MKSLAVVLLALSLLAVGCAQTAPSPTPSGSGSPHELRTDSVGLADLYGLRLQGASHSSEVVLPASITGDPWALYQRASANAGFNLRPHAGQRVVVKSQSIAQRIDGSPVVLWTAEKDGVVVGAWLAVTGVYPGILGLRQGAKQL
jgi:hypothetical protein